VEYCRGAVYRGELFTAGLNSPVLFCLKAGVGYIRGGKEVQWYRIDEIRQPDF
jgi:hypothetical protein